MIKARENPAINGRRLTPTPLFADSV